jgi:hypothetical protein
MARCRYDSWCIAHQSFHEEADTEMTDGCVLLRDSPEELRLELADDRSRKLFTKGEFVDICWACALHETEHVYGRCLTGATSFTRPQ